MYNVFICYPRSLEAHVSPFREALEVRLKNVLQRDASVFQDIAKSKVAHRWQDIIDEALYSADVLVVMMVPTLLDSDQCRREIIAFTQNSDRPVIPVICESMPSAKLLGMDLEKKTSDAEAKSRFECATILESWEQVDFSELIYSSNDQPEYVQFTAQLARDIRAATIQRKADEAVKAELETSELTQKQSNKSIVTKPKFLLAAFGVLALALISTILTGQQHCMLNDSLPFCKVPPPTIADAQKNVAQFFEQLANESTSISFDRANNKLSVSAPPDDAINKLIEFQPIESLLGEANATLSFRTNETGNACANLSGQPLVLTIDQLQFGDTLTFEIVAQPADQPVIVQTCQLPTSSWETINTAYAIGLGGEFFNKPNADALIAGAIRTGTRVQGPFKEHALIPDWLMIGEKAKLVFTLRKNLQIQENE